MTDAWMLRLGTAYDTTPVQDQFRTPRLPDEDRTWAALGFQYKVGKNGALDVGYAHLFVKNATSNLPNQDSAGAPPTGNLVGTYKDSVNILSLQFRQSF
jgi:long-chain fatty acid transport protein